MSTTSSTIVQTPNVGHIRQLMDRALDAGDPLELRFTVAAHGSLAEAKLRVVSLQNQFNSIRARARNIKQVQMGQKASEFTGEQIKGMYDDLACSRHALPGNQGYYIIMGRAPVMEFEIYNHRTGERILEDDPRDRRMNQLLKLFLEKAFSPTVRPPYLTDAQEREFFELNMSVATDTYQSCGVPLPPWVSGLAALALDPPEFDIVDTPMEEFGVGGEEGES